MSDPLEEECRAIFGCVERRQAAYSSVDHSNRCAGRTINGCVALAAFVRGQVEKERERCARVAEAFVTAPTLRLSGASHNGIIERAAAQIRSGKGG